MNVEFINPFLNSMSNVLATMATLEVTARTVELKNDDLPPGDVTGIISMSSPETRGTLAISFSKPVILDIVKRMLGDELEEIECVSKFLVINVVTLISPLFFPHLNSHPSESESLSPLPSWSFRLGGRSAR